ncbi:hypothetical protein HK414_22045 [Ramlibacter terrae]|uniref:Integrase n=1 Tax=Ramlibacter terrae TaxID=2732511 RepID=A0ABX6P615_9BURK|nr:hypothetical protein HK414_22045 [Ramlibacter terrae]
MGRKDIRRAVTGDILPAAARAKKRELEAQLEAIKAALDSPLLPYAFRYVESQATWTTRKHGESRNRDYLRVATPAGETPLRAFSGEAGRRLIPEFAAILYASRRSKSNKPRPAGSPPLQPLKRNTVRLFLTALFRLLAWIRTQLPKEAEFIVPDLEEMTRFGWALPAAHAVPRTREPSALEFAQILRVIGVNSPLGELLQIQDETGCRLSEVAKATGSRVTFIFGEKGELVGGNLHWWSTRPCTRSNDRATFPCPLVAARLPAAGPQETPGRRPAVPDAAEFGRDLQAVRRCL